MKFKISVLVAMILLIVLGAIASAGPGIPERLVSYRIQTGTKQVRITLQGGTDDVSGHTLHLSRWSLENKGRVLLSNHATESNGDYVWIDFDPYDTPGRYFYEAVWVKNDKIRKKSNAVKAVTLAWGNGKSHKPYAIKTKVQRNKQGSDDPEDWRCEVKLSWQMHDTEKLDGFIIRRKAPGEEWENLIPELGAIYPTRWITLYDVDDDVSTYSYTVRSKFNSGDTATAKFVTVTAEEIESCLAQRREER